MIWEEYSQQSVLLQLRSHQCQLQNDPAPGTLAVSIFSCRDVSLLLKGQLGPPESVGNKENYIKEIYIYHLGFKKSFQKILASIETVLKTKYAAQELRSHLGGNSGAAVNT